MKSEWRTGPFNGLKDRLENIKNLWGQIIDLEKIEIDKKATALKNAMIQSKLADDFSKIDKKQLKARVISDDMD